MKIFHNHVGYNINSNKKAVIESKNNIEGQEFQIKTLSGEIKYTGKIKKSGTVDQWRNFNFYIADFSVFQEPGQYSIEISSNKENASYSAINIRENLLQKELLSDLTTYFKAQRSSGRFDKADRSIPFFGGRNGMVDVHGGWFDASGDMSKYLSHLSYANFMNPQQTPMAVWNLLESAENIKSMDALKSRMIDEAVYGADFLMRMQDPEGYFYQIVFDGWTKNLERRMICSYSTQKGILSENYQAAFRQGGGMAIAALARISVLTETFGDYAKDEYYTSAEKGFLHLKKNNLKYLPDGEENIIDDYCALLAATELYKAKKEPRWHEAAEKRLHSLCARLHETSGFTHWMSDNKKTRPFFHASDAGLPIVALLRFYDDAKPQTKNIISMTVKKSLQSELAVTNEVNNPFGYARQTVKPLNGGIKTSFFIPHENETGYWWQGENARLSSLAAAAFSARKLPECNDIAEELKTYAANQINWILGCNPFDICMMHGKGKNNPQYADFVPNISGGVCNGITSGFKNENDIDFLPEECSDSYNDSWRWSEQWIPHAAWLLLAVSLADDDIPA